MRDKTVGDKFGEFLLNLMDNHEKWTSDSGYLTYKFPSGATLVLGVRGGHIASSEGGSLDSVLDKKSMKMIKKKAALLEKEISRLTIENKINRIMNSNPSVGGVSIVWK